MRKIEDFLFRLNSEFSSCNKRASKKAGAYSAGFCVRKINVMTVIGICVSRDGVMSRSGEDVNIMVKGNEHNHADDIRRKHK